MSGVPDPSFMNESTDHLRDLWVEASEDVARRVAAGDRPGVKELLMPLMLQVASSTTLKADSAGFWEDGAARLWLPRFVFQRTQIVKHRYKIGIFAGIHGDEPAGILGLMDFVRELDDHPELGKEFHIHLYPLCNPSGYLAGTREASSGKDLNREFWRSSAQPEVQFMEAELQRRNFDGIIALHSDDTCGGFYGFARDRLISEQMLAPALAAAGKILPCDPGSVIDGFHAVNGIIHSAYDGILCASPTQRPQPFEVILESPQTAPLDLQRQAFVQALRAILISYRGFMAYGGDL
ncbi:MAG: peptidase [Verrucomicrobiales bacterium]|nr:peptidase [Verrucomicrobiales bacterium]